MEEPNRTDRFSFFVSYYEGIKREPDGANREKMFMSICEYVFDGVLPALDYPLDMWFAGVKPNLDNSIRDVQNGRKGGRPRKNENAVEKEHEREYGKEKKGTVSTGDKSGVKTGVSNSAGVAPCPYCGNMLKPNSSGGYWCSVCNRTIKFKKSKRETNAS